MKQEQSAEESIAKIVFEALSALWCLTCIGLGMIFTIRFVILALSSISADHDLIVAGFMATLLDLTVLSYSQRWIKELLQKQQGKS